MVWRPEDPQGDEAAKIRHMIVPWTRGTGLDLGCGVYKAFPHFTGIDSGKQYGGANIPGVMYVPDCSKLPFLDATQDFVFSSHLLEHITDHKAALAEWWRVLKPGGSLVLYLPHKLLYPNVGEPGANPDHKHDFMPEDIVAAMREVAPSWMLVEDETRDRGREYSFYQVYVKTEDGKQVERPWRRGEGKRLLLIRYGAVGDQIMASSILPGLKEKGYRITYMTTPNGLQVLRYDPHVEEFLLQDVDQVPNQELGEFWKAMELEGRWDVVLNLSETIEAAVLTERNKASFWWPDAGRRNVFGSINYVEYTHKIADVPYEPGKAVFYATNDEVAWARNERMRIMQAIGGVGWRPLVLWVPAGGSEHKVWPHVDIACAWIMQNTPGVLLMNGDGRAAAVTQSCWETIERDTTEKHPERLEEFRSRFVDRCQRWTIRESLTFANVAADIVVGPETGVLNSVAFSKRVRKVVMLSHSSHANLTRDWAKTAVIVPPATVACYPCHRMHHTQDHCPRGPSGAGAACAEAIPPQGVFEAVLRWMRELDGEMRQLYGDKLARPGAGQLSAPPSNLTRAQRRALAADNRKKGNGLILAE